MLYSALFSNSLVHVVLTALLFLAVFYWLYRKYKVENLKRESLLAELEQKVAERTRELREANKEMQRQVARYEETELRLTEQLRRSVAAEEREQMARSLQDSFGQAIGYINVQAQAARALLEKNETQAALENLQLLAQAAQEAQSELRAYILGLQNTERSPHSFFESLRRYLEAFSRAWDIETVFSSPQDTLPLLPETVEDQALQIIQEALVNIRKHAKASRVEVLMTLLPREILLAVSDNGQGFDPAQVPGVKQKRFGLSIMRERAEQMGGRLEARSAPGQGTQIIAHIPRLISETSRQAPETLRRLRILLAASQPLFLEGMKNLLAARGLTVIGLARDGYEAVEQTRALHPGLVLMEARMPNLDGAQAARIIKRDFPEIKVALLAGEEEERALIELVRAGISGCLPKTMDANELVASLTSVMRGETVVPPGWVSRLVQESAAQAAPAQKTLTARQREILQMVAKGLTYKEVARILNVSEATVKYHMGQIIERLGVKNREQAVTYALRAAFNPPPS